MTTQTSRPRGRPVRAILSTESIVAAARRLLEGHGTSFTMSMLASELGVAVSSLYNHVRSRDDVLSRISDDVVSGIDTSALEQLARREPGSASIEEWRDATAEWATSYHAEFARQPSVVASLATTPVAQAPQTLAMYESVVGAFLAAGWPEAEVLDVVEAIEAFLLGSALDAAAPADIFDPAEHSSAFPVMQGAYRARPDAPPPAARAFALGLDAVLDGFAARLRSLRA